jgi:hypothetical protein
MLEAMIPLPNELYTAPNIAIILVFITILYDIENFIK